MSVGASRAQTQSWDLPGQHIKNVHTSRESCCWKRLSGRCCKSSKGRNQCTASHLASRSWQSHPLMAFPALTKIYPSDPAESLCEFKNPLMPWRTSHSDLNALPLSSKFPRARFLHIPFLISWSFFFSTLFFIRSFFNARSSPRPDPITESNPLGCHKHKCWHKNLQPHAGYPVFKTGFRRQSLYTKVSNYQTAFGLVPWKTHLIYNVQQRIRNVHTNYANVTDATILPMPQSHAASPSSHRIVSIRHIRFHADTRMLCCTLLIRK